ncbi:MAG: imelysin family protein [Deltaproteobacteria bacterium]|nr:imelysin family protein [Myxococcales bacterium]MDP3215415.1 imelysin family protein [Deltaproteobacteria bacterium]
MSARRRRHGAAGMALAALLASCGDPAPVDPRSAALAAVKSALTADLAALVTAARAVQATAPAPDADGWDAARDPAAVAAQRARWREARAAYERIEGALAVLFPSLDYSTDERYDGQLVEIVARRDDDLFDGEGVTGMHAIERILWADAHPPRVVEFERALPGYVPAAFPATAAQAAAYRDGLCARLVRDVEQMQREFAPLALDSAAAFRGVIGSMQEQAEKVESAASAEEESRYAQATLFDLRNNLAGAQAAWGAFRPWVRSRGGAALAEAIDARFAALAGRYAAIPGDAIPPVPEGWNPDAPTDEQLRSPFGQLRAFVLAESDPAHDGGLVSEMNRAADLLDIPRLP